ncbi:Tat pathway signal sequence domain protein [Streptomyces sp. IBSBF 3136]|uniref:Tat pathway signal sequence domain protein n=1 Tax=Streptomyces sp. IBSBF 3136 TaxID=2903524 RepID=UPI002FDBA9BD
MSGTGPLEPGEGTRAWDAAEWEAVGRRRTPLAALYARHRRAALAAAAAVIAVAGGGYLYATRPQQPPLPQVRYPAQVMTISYLRDGTSGAGAPAGGFRFDVLLTVDAGPPVTVSRVGQPYAGLRLTTEPRTPFRTKAGSPRKITITMHVTDCGKVPKDAGLPFLEVTLRNTRAIQNQSFILGRRYAQHLSTGLKVACSNSIR